MILLTGNLEVQFLRCIQIVINAITQSEAI